MKIIYAGTSEFAAINLKALYNAGHIIKLVLTQPDKPSGRTLKIIDSPVKKYALAYNIPILQPISLQLQGKFPIIADAVHKQLLAIPHDIIVVAAYGLILPRSILQIPNYGCINIHASLLPRWRGAAPIHRAIEAGDTKTGISIIQMEESLDTGPILMQETIPIDITDNTNSLHNKLANLSKHMIVETIKKFQQGNILAIPQSKQGITYAKKISKKEAILDFKQSANILSQKIRAFNPFPGASTYFNGIKLKLWQAQALFNLNYVGAEPGYILTANKQCGILIACGYGLLQVTEIQKPGARRLLATEFLQGFSMKNGKLQ